MSLSKEQCIQAYVLSFNARLGCDFFIPKKGWKTYDNLGYRLNQELINWAPSMATSYMSGPGSISTRGYINDSKASDIPDLLFEIVSIVESRSKPVGGPFSVSYGSFIDSHSIDVKYSKSGKFAIYTFKQIDGQIVQKYLGYAKNRGWSELSPNHPQILSMQGRKKAPSHKTLIPLKTINKLSDTSITHGLSNNGEYATIALTNVAQSRIAEYDIIEHTERKLIVAIRSFVCDQRVLMNRLVTFERIDNTKKLTASSRDIHEPWWGEEYEEVLYDFGVTKNPFNIGIHHLIPEEPKWVGEHLWYCDENSIFIKAPHGWIPIYTVDKLLRYGSQDAKDEYQLYCSTR